jgi:hypothetical protein
LYIEENPDELSVIQRVVQSLGFVFAGVLCVAERLNRRMRVGDECWLMTGPIFAMITIVLKRYAEKALTAGGDVNISKQINIRELWIRVDANLGTIENPRRRAEAV